MPENESSAHCTGVDIGTSRIVVADMAEGEIRYRSQLNAFVTVPFSKLTGAALEKEGIPHAVHDGEMIVFGHESERLADLLHTDTRRPMLNGTLNPSEPDSLELVDRLLASLAGDGRAGRCLCFSTPGPPLAETADLAYHESALRQALAEFGDRVSSLNEGLAVVYAELADSNYTGIGVSCGGGLCNACLAYLSVPVVTFSVPKAGDFIDAASASVTGELATRVRILKEQSFALDRVPPDKTRQALRVYYDEMIRGLIGAMAEAFTNARVVPRLGRPLPIVLSGGSALPAGFRDRFEAVLRSSEFPLEIGEVRLAEQPLYTTAKGCLVAAMSE